MASDTKPYLLRALYEWCVDNDFTPHIVCWVNEQTRVPMQYVRDNEIVLNIGPAASHNLIIDNEWVSFSARFAGVSHEIWIPVGHVQSIFARETGEGMGFEVVPLVVEEEQAPSLHILENDRVDNAADQNNEASEKDKVASASAKPKKGLRLVK